MGYKIPLEVPLFVTTFGFMLTISVTNNLIIYRTCYVILGYNKSECALLGFVDNNATENLEKLVEPTSDYITLCRTIVDSVFGSILCLFFAPWSDRFGRKPILVLGLVGATLSMLLHVAFAAWDKLSPWFLLGVSIPVLLTGGGPSFMTILSAYLTDTTTKEKRGFRMGVFDVVLSLAVLLGNTASSYVLIATNYVIVYCIAALCHLLGLVFTIFFISESLQERESENRVAEFFNKSNFVQMVKTPFKRREKPKRTILLLIMVVLLLLYLSWGSGSIGFLFYRQKLHWTLKQITWFGSVGTILEIVGTFFVVYLLHTVLHIKEATLIFVGFLFSAVSFIFTGLAVSDWQIYLAAFIKLPGSGQNAMTRALISKLVREDEIAKILSAFSIGSAILGPISSSGYTVLYNATIDINPGIFNFVTAGLTFVSACLFLVILIVQRRAVSEDYSRLENEPVGSINNMDDDIVTNGVHKEEATES